MASRLVVDWVMTAAPKAARDPRCLVPQGLELGGSKKWIDGKVYLVNKVLKGGWWSLILPRKEMVDHAAAEGDGRCRHNTTRGGGARKETRGESGKQSGTNTKLGTYLEGEAPRVVRVRVRVGRGGGVVDLLTARQNGCPAGPMKEVESDAPKISRPLAWLRDCPVQEDDEEGRS